MKTFKPSLLILVILFLTSLQTKAQDDIAGWYADGVKVDKISCYGFKKLQLVVPYNSEWASYTHLSVNVFSDHSSETFPGTKDGGGCKLIPMTSINAFIQGNYIVYSLFQQGDEPAGDLADFIGCPSNEGLPYELSGSYNSDYFRLFKLYRWHLKVDNAGAKDDGKPAPDATLSFQLFGVTQTGIKEAFSSVCNCIEKKPIYNKASKLTKKYNLVCTNRVIKGRKIQLNKADFNGPCTFEGAKVDFASGKSSSNSNTNSNSTNNTPVKTETPVKTSVTNNTSSNTGASSALKPLDKNKPGYFAEKNGNIVTREGYKKGNVLNGEVRDYNDDGKIRSIYTFVNDSQNGYSATFYDNGKIELTGNYKNGEKEGEWKEYNSDGKLLNTKKYVNGEVQD